MRELLHLMAKDWRYIRLWAVASWALVIGAWAVLDLAGDPTLRHVLGIVHFIAWVLPFVAVVRLIQLDPVLDSRAFLATRPINRAVLLLSKLAVAFGAVLAPCLLFSVAPLAVRGLGLAPRDYGLAAAAMLVRYLWIAWFVLIVAAVTRGLGQAALLSAALAIALAAIAHFSSYGWNSTAREDTTFTVALALLLPAQAIACLGVLYRTRRLAAAVGMLVLTGAALLTLKAEWRWNVMAFAAPPAPLAHPVGRRTVWPVRVEFLEMKGRVLQWGLGSASDRRATAVVRIHGLEPGLSLRQTGSEARLDDVAGVRRWDDFESDWHIEGYPAGRWMPSPVSMLGCRAGADKTGMVQVVSLPGTGESWRADWERIKRIDRITGRLKFSVVRWSVRERANVDGGALRFPGGRIVGTRPRGESGAAVALRQERLMLHPFPSALESPRPVLFSPNSADCLFLDDVTRAGGASMTLPIGVEEERAARWSRTGRSREMADGPVPEGTEMLFLDHEMLGTLEVPFDLPGPAATSKNVVP
jgi:hypothetical protein